MTTPAPCARLRDIVCICGWLLSGRTCVRRIRLIFTQAKRGVKKSTYVSQSTTYQRQNHSLYLKWTNVENHVRETIHSFLLFGESDWCFTKCNRMCEVTSAKAQTSFWRNSSHCGTPSSPKHTYLEGRHWIVLRGVIINCYLFRHSYYDVAVTRYKCICSLKHWLYRKCVSVPCLRITM